MAFGEIFKAISDPVRREILVLLKGGRMSAGDIAGRFDMTGATISYHLSQLKKAELIFEKKEKNFIYYELNPSVTDELAQWISQFSTGKEDFRGKLMLNMSDPDVLREYLLDKGIVNAGEEFTARYCGGGVSCTVCFVTAGSRNLIIKQGLQQLKVKETWLCDPNRMDAEQEANRIYHEIMPDCAPDVYGYDGENYIYWREAVPDSWRMWKADLLAGKLDFGAAEKVINALLAVHNACATREEVKKRFENKDIFYYLRVSPYIEFTLGKYPELRGFAQPLISKLMDSSITLVHGDFSPKNIMTDGDRVSILDYEVAHYGHPAFDLAFFCNHFVLKAVKNRKWAASYLNMLEYMMDIYFAGVTCMDTGELESVYVRLLSILMIARVDGKSPAEYITLESDKTLIRGCARAMIDEKVERYGDAVKLILTKINEKAQEK